MEGKEQKVSKKLAFRRGNIYRKRIQQPEFEDFYLPFGGRLRSDNRWVKLAELIPFRRDRKRVCK